MADNDLGPVPKREERWYRFTQREILDRAFWIKAGSLEEARRKKRDDPGGLDGVPDLAGYPSDIRIVGRGQLETEQELADARAEELGIDVS